MTSKSHLRGKGVEASPLDEHANGVLDPKIEVPDNAIKPTQKQQEFLEASEEELLWGGSAGTGKSFILRVALLGLNEPDGPAITAPHYRAVIIRKTYPDLLDFRNLCLEMYPQIVPGVRWKESESTFIFPSGARVILRHLKEEADVQWFQGQELQFVGWDELTHQPSPYGYNFLKSRLRSRVTASGTLNKYVRATTNPGGPGHEWVKEHWRIPDDGSATCFPVDVQVPLPDGTFRTEQRWRRFIPARITDNPHVDPDYVVELAALGEDLRKRLLEGRWDVTDTKGVIYAEQMMRASEEGRICDLPIHTSVPVNTFFDLGRDTIAVWMHQHVDGWDNFIDYVEFKQISLDEIARTLQNKGYVFGLHVLPHDAEHKNVLAGEKTARSMLEDLGIKPTVVVPRIPNLLTGIQMVRNALNGCRFDKSRCADGLKALRQYRFEWNNDRQTFTDKPLHNWASHGADAFRQFAQGYRQQSTPASAIGSNQFTRRRRRDGHDKLRRPRARHIL